MNDENEVQTADEVTDVGAEEQEELPEEDISTEDAEGDQEDSDPFDDLYEEEGEEETEVSDEEADTDKGEDSPGAEAQEPSEEDKRYSELEEAARELLKSAGVENVSDPVAELRKLTAEALGISEEEYNRRLAATRAEQAAWDAQTKRDIDAIHEAYPETRKYKTLRDLPNVAKFAKLMDDPSLGLTAVGAFAASHPDIVDAHGKFAGRKSNLAGTKAHINSSVPKGAKDTGTYISKSDMARYKEMFGDELSDAEIRALHKKVSK